MADFVWPEDAGTGAAQGDDNDAANFATAYHAVGLKNYVVQGLGFTLNAGTPSLDIGSGKAVVDDPSATATQSSETRNEGVSYVAEMDARTGISLTDSAINHVFLQVDLSTDDTINIVVNTTNSAPSEPQVKLGTVDTSNNTATELNRDIPVDLGNLSSKTFSELSNASISSASAGETILYDGSNSEFVNSSISAGNGLGSSSSDGGFTLDVASNGIGTDELDESAGFDFNSAIRFSGGIDGGGSAISVSDDLNINNNNLDNISKITGNTGTNFQISSDGSGTIKFFTDDSSGSSTNRLNINPDLDTTTIEVFNSTLDLNNNFINGAERLQITNSGTIIDGSANTHITFNDGGKLGVNRDLDINGNQITDSAGGFGVTMGSNLDLNNNQIRRVAAVRSEGSTLQLVTDDSAGGFSERVAIGDSSDRVGIKISNADLNLNSNDIDNISTLKNQKGSSLVVQTEDSNSNYVNRVQFLGGNDTARIFLQNMKLDLNDNLIKDVSNNTTGDSMTVDPESSSEDGYIEVEIDGTTRQIPFYNS